MSIHESDRLCSGLVEKVISGERLDEPEKGHLANCDGCMEELVGRLDKADIEATASARLNGAPGGDELPQRRPEVTAALENARRVFSREFGISIPS
jgi:hypothetical protein